MTIEELLRAIAELRRMGCDPTPAELDCMIYCEDESEAVGAYLIEYGGGDWHEEALTDYQRNI